MSNAPPPKHLTVDPQRYGDTVFVRLTGEFDLAGEQHFEQTVTGLCADARSLVVDLSELVFIDSTGLRALLRVWERTRDDGIELAVVSGTEQVRNAMRLTGVDAVLPLVAEPPGRPLVETGR